MILSLSKAFLGRRLRVDLITLVGLKCPFVCPSTKRFFDFNEIWYVGRCRWVMHDVMQYDPIQGQRHELLIVGNSTIFKDYLLPHFWWGLANDHGFLN